MANLSAFKYKRRCSIFQKDLQKDDNDNLLVRSPVKSMKNVMESGDDNKLKQNSLNSASNLETIEKTDASPSNGTILDKDTLENDMCTSFRLEILKGVFKDAYSEDDVVNAVGNTNSLEQAVSILLDSPTKSDKKVDKVKTGMVSHELVLPIKTTE